MKSAGRKSRIAKEGALFTDWCGEQSCTAGTRGLHHGAVALRADRTNAVMKRRFTTSG